MATYRTLAADIKGYFHRFFQWRSNTSTACNQSMFVLIRRRLASRNAVYIYTGTDQCHVIPESRDTVT